MKLNSLAIGVLSLLANTSTAFVTPHQTQTYSATTGKPTTRSTRLFISSWGVKGPPSKSNPTSTHPNRSPHAPTSTEKYSSPDGSTPKNAPTRRSSTSSTTRTPRSSSPPSWPSSTTPSSRRNG